MITLVAGSSQIPSLFQVLFGFEMDIELFGTRSRDVASQTLELGDRNWTWR